MRKRAEEAVEYYLGMRSDAVVALDKSGRIAGLLFREAWKKKMGNRKQPKMFFLNPDLGVTPLEKEPYKISLLDMERGEKRKPIPNNVL
ncbi:MAG: hypothetical protein V1658_02140, partial [Candidatus Micrarchaeota archaeon]